MHRRNLVPGRPFDLVRHAYLTEIHRCTAQTIVIDKAGQMGASEYLISYAFHATDQRQATVMYVMPTDRVISDFSAARVGPALEASAYLQAIVVEGSAGGEKRGADRVTLKRVRDRFIYFRGGQVDRDGMANQLKTVDADCVILDELDEMDPRVIPITMKRLDASPLAEMRMVSTPTYAGRGIHAEYLKTDMRQWFVRCGHCGEWQPLTLAHLIIESDQLDRPLSWHGQKDQRPYLACRKCTREIERGAPGEWVAEHPSRVIAGFHLPKLINPAYDVGRIITALQQVDQTVRKECINQDLALPFQPMGGQLTPEQLDDVRREYLPGPVRSEVCVMGIDVGPNGLHVVIRSATDAGSAQRFAGVVDWARLPQLMTIYQVRSAVIDALPETTKAREFQAKSNPQMIWLAYYTDLSKSIEPAIWKAEDAIVNLDRTRTLDEMYAALFGAAATLPANARDLIGYYDQLTAPVRVVQNNARGVPVAVYLEGSKAVHFAHAENYCRSALNAPKPAETRNVSAPAQVHTAQDIFGGR